MKLKTTKGKFRNKVTDGIEVSTMANLGINLDNFDLPSIAHFHALTSDYGIDTTELGVVIGLAIEASQSGQELCGLPPYHLNWGNVDQIESLVHQISNGSTELGLLLGKGAKKFVELAGLKNSTNYLSKNLAVPSSGSVPIPDWTLGLTVSSRGGDHVKHFTFLTRSAKNSQLAKKYSEKYLGVAPTKLNDPSFKGRFVWFHENYVAAINAMGLCLFPFTKLMEIPYWKALTNIFNTVYETNLSPNELFLTAERIVQVQRAFNIREGIQREDKSISEKLNSRVGKMLNHPGMLDEYYYYRGYSPKGLPTSERLTYLALKSITSDLKIEDDCDSKQFNLDSLPYLDEEVLSR